jgi:hypothetical protein
MVRQGRQLLLSCSILTVAVFLFPLPLLAQTGVITGQVLDDRTGLVLPGAYVSVEEASRSTLSERNGRFMLVSVPAGPQVVEVRYLGYADTRQTVTVPEGGSATLTFRLTIEAVAIEGIEVVGTRDGQARALQQQRSAANITNVVAADQIGRFPDANIGDAMKRIPGIAAAVDQGEARFGLIRGTEPRLNSITDIFHAEPEGIALWGCDTGGYLLMADQSHDLNQFHVFDRESLAHLGTFAGEAVANTDGVAVLTGPAGRLGEGAFYAIHADQGAVGFSWSDVASALGLRSGC